MKERESKYSWDYLTPSTSQLILSGENIEAWRDLAQTELNAYISVSSKYFVGLHFNPEAQGPEVPYFFMEHDDLPVDVVMTSQVGVQAQYWALVAAALHNQSINPAEVINAETLPVRMDQGRLQVRKYRDDYVSGRMEHIVKKCGDTHRRFHTYAPGINFGGDADFFGSSRNHILHDHGLNVEDFGVDPDITDDVWNTWNAHRQLRADIFTRGYYQFLDESRSNYPNVPFENFHITSDIHLAREFLMNGIPEEILMNVYNGVLEVCNRPDFDSTELQQTIQKLSEGLHSIYNQARAHLGSAYPYL